MDDEVRVNVGVKWEIIDGDVWHKKLWKVLLICNEWLIAA